jgi:purine-binding chemotaxis protein CheW
MTASALQRQFVVFSLKGETYGVPIASVHEIIRYAKPTPVRATSALIQGVINLRGRVVPVADLSSRLGHEPEIDSRTRILMLDVADGTVGLIVDSVDGVREIPVANIGQLPVAVGDGGVGDEIATIDDQLVVLMDAERTFGSVFRSPPTSSAPGAP